MVSSHALLETTAVFVFLIVPRHASASLFNFTDAAVNWSDGGGRTPSTQACSTLWHATPWLGVSGSFPKESLCATTTVHSALNLAFEGL